MSSTAPTLQAAVVAPKAEGSTGPLILRSVADIRAWRNQARKKPRRTSSSRTEVSDAEDSLPTIGFVPTMGALHDGHLSLVQASLEENDHTVVSIFVNPAQFAPHEDLDAYPRTLESDLAKLQALSSSGSTLDGGGGGVQGAARKVDVVFAPTVSELYPNGFTQRVEDQVGAFVEIRGLASEMEGKSRPGFFRGVATVVTKLFHIVQKDIQQAIILRRLLSDLIFAYPPSPAHLKVLRTGRDSTDGLALSSRNAYLTPRARSVAPVLYRALREGERVYGSLVSTASQKSPTDARSVVETTLTTARNVVLQEAQACASQEDQNGAEERIYLDLDYISLNDPHSLADLERELQAGKDVNLSRGAILSGAALIRQGKDGRSTRLIDNILLGFTL
ncbi:pantoate-beta-alanine ligase [Tilletia horrida]|uniref:Pantoate--beta-alanine ligase n=1 Tax=Tilletia horrida TaxID=155126 RepID=A0AAN6GEH4_9BASI|nr:pantoate-beta-alanine ligase [Tilletia horrida]